MAKPTKIDLKKGYVRLSSQKGSNQGGFFRNKKSGAVFYIKWLPANTLNKDNAPAAYSISSNNDRIQNEFLALKLYELFGTAVPKSELITFSDKSGNLFYGLATEKESNIAKMTPSLLKNNTIRQKIQEDFLIDVLLSNYDVAGLVMDNIFWNPSTKSALRLDTGGALKYRAQGAPKNNQWNAHAHEFEEMVSADNKLTGFHPEVLKQASRLYKGIYESRALTISLKKLLLIDDQAIIDCVNEFSLESPNNKPDQNDELIKLLLSRKKRLIEKAEEKTFNQLIKEFHHIPCSAQDNSYKDFTENTIDPIYRVKHGGMHASRVALYTENIITLLQNQQFSPAMNLTAKDRFLIKVAAMFHDTGRKFDQGNDKKEWEEQGAQKCRTWLSDAGFGTNDIDMVCEAIIHKDDTQTQNKNVIALVLAASDSLDWVRSHSSDFRLDYLPEKIKELIPKEQLLELATRAKQLASMQGDSPRAQLDQEGVFSITTKKKYEQHPHGCYYATRQLYSELVVPQEIIKERNNQLHKILNFFKVEAHKKYSDTERLNSIDKFIETIKKNHQMISPRHIDDNTYKDHLEGSICQLAVQAFPHRHTLMRLVLDLILWPLFFITKAVTGSWFFSTADTRRAHLIKNELITVEKAVKNKNWGRFNQLLERGEAISEEVREKAVKNITKDGQWEVAYNLEKTLNKEKYTLVCGPLEKLNQTMQLEELCHQLLTLEDFKMSEKDKNNIITFKSGKIFNLTDIFKYANMSHLNLSPSDFSLYEKHFIISNMKTYLHQLKPKFPDLHIAEMQAIRRYSGNNYNAMNALLRGSYSYNLKSTSTIRSTILDTLLCGSGLARIPDSTISSCYRGEGIYNKMEHYNRIKAAAMHGVVQLSGFVSTSTSENRAFGGEVKFTINKLRGKFIRDLAINPWEQEFLILPTQVQIQNYEYKSGRHHFTGDMVSDLAHVASPDSEADPQLTI